MPVLKTASPKVSPSAPYDVPRKARPSSRTSSAGRSLIVAVLSVAHSFDDDPCAEHQEHRDRHHAGDDPAPSRSLVHAGFPSSTVGRPRRKVATTRAGSSRTSKGVLRLRLALCPRGNVPPGPRAAEP